MDRPKVGLGVIIVKDGNILLGKRKSKHGEGTWCAPGGHLEGGESWEECSARETLKETGIILKKSVFLDVINQIFPDKHYVTITMRAIEWDGEAKVTEPDKWEKWDWFPLDNLPQPLFYPYNQLPLPENTQN